MKTRRTIGVVALLLAASVAAGAAAYAAEPGVETLRVPVAEGIALATEVYHPAQEPAPAILVRTPYGRQGLEFLGRALAEGGYVVAIQDVRGKYDSDGEHEPFVHERADGLATLRWLDARPWTGDRIGMWGSSYSGFAALVVADADVESFRSIFSISGWLDAERIARPGGAMHLLLNLPWMLAQQGRSQRGIGEFDMDALFRHVPLQQALRAAGIRNPYWEDPGWMDRVGSVTLGDVPRAIYHLTGWHDMVYRATLQARERLASHTSTTQRLAIGPWYHNQFLFESFEVGDADFGTASGLGTAEVVALTLRWFDATLRGRDNGLLDEPPVSYFLMGQNGWHRDRSWPPRKVHEQHWFLESAGSANGSAGDGRLVTAAPDRAAADRFVYDPEDPVPTLGGANFFYFPELLGVRDQREIERRDDVLVYTSAPLERTLQITGPVSAALDVSTTAPATDFTAKLVIVRPDGYARIVEEGIARVRRPAGVDEDEPFTVVVDIGHTAVEVPVGHRLRLEVSSSNFPKYDRNPNTGENPFTATELRPATQRVHHGPGHRSRLVLPVRRKPLVADARSRRPLVEPVANGETDEIAAVAAAGDDVAALLEQARDDLEADQVDRAVATLERVLELRPEDADGHYWLARAYLVKLNDASMFKKLGYSKKVRAGYGRALELDPDHGDAREGLAQYLFNAPAVAGGSFEKGLEQARELERREPLRAHVLLGQVYTRRKDYAAALGEYEAALGLAPEDADLHYRVGLVCQLDERWDRAFAEFERAIALGDDLRSLYQIGRTGVFSGQRLAQAREALEDYVAREPDSERLPSVANALWRLGMIHELEQHDDLARKAYERALALDPDNEQAREALENL